MIDELTTEDQRELFNRTRARQVVSRQIMKECILAQQRVIKYGHEQGFSRVWLVNQDQVLGNWQEDLAEIEEDLEPPYCVQCYNESGLYVDTKPVSEETKYTKYVCGNCKTEIDYSV